MRRSIRQGVAKAWDFSTDTTYTCSPCTSTDKHLITLIENMKYLINRNIKKYLLLDDTQRIPNTRAQLSRRVSLVDIQTVPTTEEAIILYEAAGGRLTRESLFGADPLRNHAHLIQERERLFGQTNPDFHFIQSRLANGDLVFFEAAITSFVEITRRLAMEI